MCWFFSVAVIDDGETFAPFDLIVTNFLKKLLPLGWHGPCSQQVLCQVDRNHSFRLWAPRIYKL